MTFCNFNASDASSVSQLSLLCNFKLLLYLTCKCIIEQDSQAHTSHSLTRQYCESMSRICACSFCESWRVVCRIVFDWNGIQTMKAWTDVRDIAYIALV
jgi:hypothetical protein